MAVVLVVNQNEQPTSFKQVAYLYQAVPPQLLALMSSITVG